MAVSADSLDKKAVQDIVDQHKDGKETGHGIEFVKHLGKSHLWVSFQKLKLDGVVVPYVVCTICYGVLKYTPSDGTGGMKRHVHRVRQEAASSNTQLKISGFTSTTFEPGVYRKAKKQITTSVVQFCAKDIRPFNIVEGEGFKGVARELINIGAKYGRIQVEQVLPCGQTISNNVDETYKKLKEAVNEELRKVLYVQAFVLVILMGKLFKKVFFGQLRAAEMEHLIERSWYAVTETCLAFTVFRDDFSPRFVAMFTLLLFLKCFHWLAEDRVDYMERSPVISLVFHLRVLSLLLFLGLVDAAFINFAYHSTLTKGASVQLVFGFEYAILLSIIINVFFKYILHTIDLQSENPWENKAVYMLYTDLVMGFIKVFLYTAFMAIMIKVHTFPLFAIRPMYLTMRSFKKAVNDVIMSRRAIRNMNTLYPDATPEDLATTDNLCIICREEMVTGCKKLPCSHIFHTSCLRSWFQRQQTCPTCRMDVLRAPAAQQQQQRQQQQQQNGAAGQQQQQGPQGMMPPFPGYPFWMPPFQPPGAAPMGFPPGGALPPGFPPPPGGANGQQPGGQQQPAGDQTEGDQPDSGTQPASSAASSQSSGTTTTTTTTSSSTSSAPVFPPPPGTSFPGGFGQGVPPMPGGMPPPFMPPPPFMFMPPFGVPPPMPPPNFSGMSEDEIRAMEGNERRHLEARVECLRSIHSLLDAAMVQVQQYTAIVGSLGSTIPAPPAASLYPQANTTTVSSTTTVPTASAASSAAVSPTPDAATAAVDAEDLGAENKTEMKKAKDSSADLTQLEGAVGFTPPTEGELIPDATEEDPNEHDHQEIRRRRLQRLSSQTEGT